MGTLAPLTLAGPSPVRNRRSTAAAGPWQHLLRRLGLGTAPDRDEGLAWLGWDGWVTPPGSGPAAGGAARARYQLPHSLNHS
jgi:hypothetical protein